MKKAEQKAKKQAKSIAGKEEGKRKEQEEKVAIGKRKEGGTVTSS